MSLSNNKQQHDSSGDLIDYYDDEHDNDDPTLAIRTSIERLGCHVPLCIARSLEDYAFEESQQQSKQQNGNKNSSCRRGSNPNMQMGSSELSWTTNTTISTKTTTQHQRFNNNNENRRLSCGGASVSSTSNHSMIMDGSDFIPGLYSMPLPDENKYYWSAILLVDISGFTRLSTLLDVESLSKAINTYFELLIKQVEIYGGDVLKFAGDAFFAEWREEDAESMEDLDDAVLSASQCGASIVKKYSQYQVLSDLNDAKLDVHAGVSAGQVATLHVGNNDTRREFLVLGDPIHQVATAEEIASNGQLAASPEAIGLLKTMCDIDIPDELKRDSCDGPQVIANHERQFFEPTDNDDPFGFDESVQPYKMNIFSPQAMKPLRHQMSLYVHQAAREESTTRKFTLSADAEIRSVYTMFIMPEIDPRITGGPTSESNDLSSSSQHNNSTDYRLFALLNDIMGVTLRVLDQYKGHLRQFIVDDKGVVLIATFGQRGATFPNMVTEKGLPATIALYDALKIDLNVTCKIGATFGKAYCGVVGGLHRHEFAVLGPSVNLAARLMSSKDNPGILVDDALRLVASKRYDFLSRPPVKAKGYLDLVPIFEPKSALERQWNKINNFVGRQVEMKQIVNIGRNILLSKRKHHAKPLNNKVILAPLVLIQAHSGLGKSSLAMQAIEVIRRIGSTRKKTIVIKKGVCVDGEIHVPFSVFRQLILDLLMERDNCLSGHDIGTSDNNSGYESDASSISMDEDLETNAANSDVKMNNTYMNQLRLLCTELNKSAEFANSVGENMLGLQLDDDGPSLIKKDKLQPNDVLDFVADAFLKCTCKYDLILLALDDVQWMDSLSFMVVQRLLERGSPNLMVIFMARPLPPLLSHFDLEFVKKLREEEEEEENDSNNNNEPDKQEHDDKDDTSTSAAADDNAVVKHKSKIPRFTEIQLLPFTRKDVRLVLANSFECEEECIDDEVCDYLYEVSGGMPYFAQEIVGNMIQNEFLEWRDNGSVGWRSDLGKTDKKKTYASVHDLLLHRLDHFKSDAKQLLQVCAILGFEFTLSELLLFQGRGRKKLKPKQIQKIQDILDKADKERILVHICRGGTGSASLGGDLRQVEEYYDRTEGRSYQFSHAIWRNCLLGTMLKEQKRDLHKTVAMILEPKKGGGNNDDDNDEIKELKSALKLFGHWKESGVLGKASNLARKIGKHLDSLLILRDSITVCLDAIDMWKEKRSTGDSEELIAGISPKLLNSITPDELESLARLHISVAKNYCNIEDAENGNVYYQNCDCILTKSTVTADLKDRSVFFALYSGMFSLLKSGVIADDDHVVTLDLVRRFVKQAQIHGDPVHITRALAMESLTMGGIGRFEEAVDAQKRLEEIYDAKTLSAGICREYASDRAAQNYGYAVICYELLERHEEAQKLMDFISQDLMPVMPKDNVHNSMMILFPVLIVLLEQGRIKEAESAFCTHVYNRFYEFYGEDSTTLFLSTYKPLRVLFRLLIEAQEGVGDSNGSEEDYKDTETWILSEGVGKFVYILAFSMSKLGRDPHLIVAEICLRLVMRRSWDNSNEDDKTQRQLLLKKGVEQLQKAKSYYDGNPGHEYARRHGEKIRQELCSCCPGSQDLGFVD